MKRGGVNVSASLWAGELVLSYDCPGESNCRYDMCNIQPRPAGYTEPCAMLHTGGTCLHPGAQLDALRRLGAALKKAEAKLQESLDKE